MSNVIPFDFRGSSVRVIEIEHNPWFVAKDVAETLGYAKPENAIARHCKAGTTTPKQGGGVITIIPERDVYRLIMRSKLPEAEAFEEWVVGEVLPSIRKTGGYHAGNLALPDFSNPAEAARAWADQHEQIERQTAQIVEFKPKAEFYDQVASAQDAISVGEAAKIIGTGRRRLFAFMRHLGWVTRKNEPYQAKIEQGYLDVKLGSWEHPDHGIQQSVTTLVTGKGLTKLQKLWAEACQPREA